jgi:hypothetical protein
MSPLPVTETALFLYFFYDNKVPRRIPGRKGESAVQWREMHNEERRVFTYTKRYWDH